MSQPIRVAIRGIGGHLGHRLALAIYRHSALRLVLGITDDDQQSLDRLAHLPERLSDQLQGALYLDGPAPRVKQLNVSRPGRFAPVSELSLADTCDVVVDTVIPLDRQGRNWYPLGFLRPILIQSGAYPQGTLIAPPLIQSTSQPVTLWRLGDCILGGLAPVLSVLHDWVQCFRVDVLMQCGQRFADYPTNEQLHAVHTNDRARAILEEELSGIVNQTGQDLVSVFVGSFLQVVGLEDYVVTLTLYPKAEIATPEEYLRARLRAAPRIWLADSSITSTYQLDQWRRQRAALGLGSSPVVVFDRFTHPFSGSSSACRQIQLTVALHWRYAAVLPTLDAVQIVAGGVDPVEAIRRTDTAMGISAR